MCRYNKRDSKGRFTKEMDGVNIDHYYEGNSNRRVFIRHCLGTDFPYKVFIKNMIWEKENELYIDGFLD